ncbi:MAG: DUF5615 family PIN-like protein [Planctomycetota bacterium]|nr:DUF5615 family PIN-like protein [Planctomycetota bacterium]
MDQHVPLSITEGLRERGVEVLTAAEDNAADWSDPDILQRASELQRVVFTLDDDFLVIAADWLESEREFAGAAYAHQLGITIGQAVRDLELMASVLNLADMRNRIEFLPYS